ncbi:Biotin transporter BioY [Pseudodesulfovibrio hydrargyri]|uniref:Biotin transporter n=1 Tax=Pseudodesulfovibrio hydrargyri TaxID=2125990 RepID=A0A1J5N3P6_9BACT|nr:biotin transporter BioY [Pseudodesulfovibrio hydrargyri]OIQ49448.1 Biotin transporter BioY [Pseudodesulfovibrio hydrargyri]
MAHGEPRGDGPGFPLPQSPLADLHRLVWTALMAALIGAGAYLIVPVGPVPVSMQPFFIFLAGYLLGPRHAVLAMGLYLLAGIVGLPVFAGGKSGLGYLLGPTGGYLIGFLGTALICGLARNREGGLPWARGVLAGLAGVGLAYLTGAVWLKSVLSLTWTKAVALGVLPFIPWDVLKVAVALACARHLLRLGLTPGRR